MKILILANKVPFPANDGGAIATQSMIMGLAQSGAQISVVAISTPKHHTSFNELPRWLTSLAQFHIVHIDTTIKPHRALANLFFSRMPYNAQRFVSPKVAALIESILSKEKFDLIQLEGLFMAPYIKSIRKLSDAPIALRAHNVEYEIWERSASIERNPLKKWYLALLAHRVKRMEKACLKQIDILVAISKRDEEMLKQMGFEGLATTSQTGSDMGNTQPCAPTEHTESIFHLGGLDWLPNQEGLLWFLQKCWGNILKSVPKAQFFIAGRNAPDNFIGQIGKYPNVVYCGEVPDSQEFMCSKGVMVVPLLSGSGMRIKIVEGMFLGKAIVSTTIGAEGIDVTSQQHMLIADSPDEFSSHIINCLNKPHLVEILGSNARLFAATHFDNKAICEQLLHFFKRSIGG